MTTTGRNTLVHLVTIGITIDIETPNSRPVNFDRNSVTDCSSRRLGSLGSRVTLLDVLFSN